MSKRSGRILDFFLSKQPRIDPVNRRNSSKGESTRLCMYIFRFYIFLHSFRRSKRSFFPVSKQLQSPRLDLVGICSIIEKLIAILEKERQDDNFMMKVFCNAKSKAQIFGSTVTLPSIDALYDYTLYVRGAYNGPYIRIKHHIYVRAYNHRITNGQRIIPSYDETEFTAHLLLPHPPDH